MSEQPLGRETEWLFHRLNTLEDKIDNQHARLRQDMTSGFEKVSVTMQEAFGKCDREVHCHALRLTVIETERAQEAKQVMKLSTTAGAVAGAGLTIITEAVKSIFGLR